MLKMLHAPADSPQFCARLAKNFPARLPLPHSGLGPSAPKNQIADAGNDQRSMRTLHCPLRRYDEVLAQCPTPGFLLPLRYTAKAAKGYSSRECSKAVAGQGVSLSRMIMSFLKRSGNFYAREIFGVPALTGLRTLPRTYAKPLLNAQAAGPFPAGCGAPADRQVCASFRPFQGQIGFLESCRSAQRPVFPPMAALGIKMVLLTGR